MFDSMLSDKSALSTTQPRGLTDHTALLYNDGSKLTEDAIELVDTRLDLSDLGLAFGNQALLELELLRGNSNDQVEVIKLRATYCGTCCCV